MPPLLVGGYFFTHDLPDAVLNQLSVGRARFDRFHLDHPFVE
jgi:hypothetical protein